MPVTVPSGMLTPVVTGTAAGAGMVNVVVIAAWTGGPVAPLNGTMVALSAMIGMLGWLPKAVYTPFRKPAEAMTVTSNVTVNDPFRGTGLADGVATIV